MLLLSIGWMEVKSLDNQRFSGSLASAVVLGVCVMLGLVAGGWLLGSQIKAIKLADRYVTVKGLVERTVKSDSAIWPVTFKEAGKKEIQGSGPRILPITARSDVAEKLSPLFWTRVNFRRY